MRRKHGERQYADELILEATIRALRSVNHVRLFRSERGYQGRFFCTLQAVLDKYGILGDDVILEMEYQKSGRHGMRQRPDIILHIPMEVSAAAIDENNFAVWALKRQANVRDARKDFDKLDEMFETLHYPLGIFINIDTYRHHLSHYRGNYPDCLIAFAVQLDEGNVFIRQAMIVEGQVVEEQV